MDGGFHRAARRIESWRRDRADDQQRSASVLLVSRNATSAGAAFVDVPVANGSTDATLLHSWRGGRARDGDADGDGARVHGRAGNGDGGRTGLRLNGPPSTTTTLSPDSPFTLQLGVLNSTGVFAGVQALRAGATALIVTITHTNPAVAQLVTTAGTGQSRTVTIVAAAFGIAEHGRRRRRRASIRLGAGRRRSSATAPGLRAASPITSTVTAPTISILSTSALVGAGLMDGPYTTRLGATTHGGVTVRVTSSDASVLLLSRNATSAGAAFVDVPVANGNTDATYYIHGVEGARGTVTLTATAPGFTAAGDGDGGRPDAAADRPAEHHDDAVAGLGVHGAARRAERHGRLCRDSGAAGRAPRR